MKSGAGSAVENIEGIERVTNQIEVLPPSPLTIRFVWPTAAIYGKTVPNQYPLRAVPPILIIVINKRIALKEWSEAGR